jgi:hypothetical protein
VVLLQRCSISWNVDWTSPFLSGKAQHSSFADCDRVTGLDLLEVFLSRRIQPLQMRDHPMWLYTGPDDSCRTHPEEVPEDTVAQWLKSITGARDNPRGAKRILPFCAERKPGEVRHIFVECLSFYFQYAAKLITE